jgi:hypothetical protein
MDSDENPSGGKAIQVRKKIAETAVKRAAWVDETARNAKSARQGKARLAPQGARDDLRGER